MKTYLKEVYFTISGEDLASLPDGPLPDAECPTAELTEIQPPTPAELPKRRGLIRMMAVAAVLSIAVLVSRASLLHGSNTEIPVETELGKQIEENVTNETQEIHVEVSVVAPVLEETATHTAIFQADDKIVETVTYIEGTDSIEEPPVPEKAGYLGAWEDYTLGGDVTIRAVYTYMPWEGVVCDDDLCIYTQPDVTADTVKTLDIGDAVKVLEETTKETEVWCKTKHGWAQRSGIADANQGAAVAEALGISLDGEWTLSTETAVELRDAIRVVTDRGYDTAFMLVDLSSRNAISFNTEQVFYCASTIKAPYICAVLHQYPEAASRYHTTIQDVLVNSSNSGYTTLRNQYGKTCWADWCEIAGVTVDLSKKWPGLTAETLCGLWMQSYEFFTTTEIGAETAAWFESPVLSPIHDVLGETYTTQSKAGWISGSNAYYRAANDAGIVYADSGTYVVAILSNVPADLTRIEPLVAALDRAHDEMNQENRQSFD